MHWLGMLLLFAIGPAGAMAQGGKAVVLEVDGAVGPATADYLQRSLRQAAEQQAQLVIIRMDTPGGLDLSMRAIIQDILAAPVPVVGFVAPGGARAASAGTFILYASHIAAMAPATSIGAATPVQIAAPLSPGGGGSPPESGKAPPGDAMAHKVINDAVAYIRGLAQMRGRNAQWAERAVREAATLTAEEALAEGVIDLLANDIPDLLAKLDGRQVEVLGQTRTLSTAQLGIDYVRPDWRSELLAIITNPNIAYILMLVGIYGLIYEFANPGMILPGVVGAVCLVLALFAFQVLPINYAGLGLILLGVAFMVAEVFVPSFGALGVGGVIAFVIGSVILMESDIPGYGLSLPLIIAVALVSAGFFMAVVGLALRARRRPVVSGQEEMLGALGEVLEDFTGRGRIHVHGENWSARCDRPLQRGQRVRVTGMDGLTLIVEPQTDRQKEDR